MKKVVTIMCVTFMVCILFTGCGYSANKTNQEKETAESAAIDQKEKKENILEGEEIVELISVGDAQVALCQGDSEDSVKIMLVRDEKEIVLAEFAWKATNWHIEPFEGVLGHDGFRLYERVESPYGATVYYVGLEGEKAKLLMENHAIYDEETKEYSADFEYVMDIDEDGDQEIISNISYIMDGGMDACLYDYQKGAVYTGSLTQLLEEEYYIGRATDMGAWYDPEDKKVTIHYLTKEKPHEREEKKYEIDLDKIELEKEIIFYKSDELKDIHNYGDDEE